MIPFLNEAGRLALPVASSMLWQTAVLVMGLLFVEFLAGRRLRATFRCGLWLLVILKLLLPPSLKSPLSPGYWIGRWITPPLALPVASTATTIAQVNPVVSASIPFPRVEGSEASEMSAVSRTVSGYPQLNAAGALMGLWILGSLTLACGVLRRNQQVRRLTGTARPASADLLDALRSAAAELGLRRLPELRLTQADHSPAVSGFFHPVIVLPAELAAHLTPSALRDVLLHELIHVRRRDLWLNLPQALVQIIWWWNPFVWLASARIRLLREQAVDEQVMLLTQGEEESTYPATLVAVARYCADRPVLTLSFVGILESRHHLRSRVERLLNGPLPPRAGLGRRGWLTLVLTACLALPMAFARRADSSLPGAELSARVYRYDPDRLMAALEERVSSIPSSESSPATTPDRSRWLPWSADRVRIARQKGQTVLVDFTAKWCVACRVNRHLVLEDPTIAKFLEASDVLMLEADWTQANAAIAEALAALGRPGVPAVIVYPGAADSPPIVLPEQLTREALLVALEFPGLQKSPANSRAEGRLPEIIHLQLLKDSPFFSLNGRKLSEVELLTELRTAVSGNPNTLLAIHSSATSSYPAVAKALLTAKLARVTRVVMKLMEGNDTADVRSHLLGPISPESALSNISDQSPGRAKEEGGAIKSDDRETPQSSNPSTQIQTNVVSYVSRPAENEESAPKFYAMDPILARRYGLIPSTSTPTNSPPPATSPKPDSDPSVYGMDPLLARRYGFPLKDPQRTNDSRNESPPKLYGMDPILARRYGLIPPTSTPTNSPPPAASSKPEAGPPVYAMDPELARRYGLIPKDPQQSTGSQPRSSLFHIRIIEVSEPGGLNLSLDSMEMDTDRAVISGIEHGPVTEKRLAEFHGGGNARVIADFERKTPSGRRIDVAFDEAPLLVHSQPASFATSPGQGNPSLLELLPTVKLKDSMIELAVVVRRHPDDPNPVQQRAKVVNGDTLVLVLQPMPSSISTQGSQAILFLLVTPTL